MSRRFQRRPLLPTDRRVVIDRPQSAEEQHMRTLRRRLDFLNHRLDKPNLDPRARRAVAYERDATGWAIHKLDAWLMGELGPPPRPPTERERVFDDSVNHYRGIRIR